MRNDMNKREIQTKYQISDNDNSYKDKKRPAKKDTFCSFQCENMLCTFISYRPSLWFRRVQWARERFGKSILLTISVIAGLEECITFSTYFISSQSTKCSAGIFATTSNTAWCQFAVNGKRNAACSVTGPTLNRFALDKNVLFLLFLCQVSRLRAFFFFLFSSNMLIIILRYCRRLVIATYFCSCCHFFFCYFHFILGFVMVDGRNERVTRYIEVLIALPSYAYYLGFICAVERHTLLLFFFSLFFRYICKNTQYNHEHAHSTAYTAGTKEQRN